MRISSAEFQKKFGSPSGRRVVRLEDFSDEEMALIAKADVAVEYAYLDAELKDWRP